MSYILDALKKAESERERGAVPGLNSAQANHTTFIRYGSDQKPWWLVALVLGVLLAVVVAVWAWRQATPGPLVASTNSSAAPANQVVVAPDVPIQNHTPAQNPARLPTPEVKAPVVVMQKPDVPARAPMLAPAPVPVAAKASPVEAATSTVAHVQAKVVPPSAGPTISAAPLTPAAPVKPAQSAIPAPPVAPAATEPVSKATPISTPIRSASGGVPMLNELPEAMRRQIPALNISGAVYSDSPPEWTLIINDQLIGKGGQVAPDVRLEEISGSSAVFNFKGQRFRIDR
jgi:general secretion pathway protein B